MLHGDQDEDLPPGMTPFSCAAAGTPGGAVRASPVPPRFGGSSSGGFHSSSSTPSLGYGGLQQQIAPLPPTLLSFLNLDQEVGCVNLTHLDPLNEETVLSNLFQRYKRDQIYVSANDPCAVIQLKGAQGKRRIYAKLFGDMWTVEKGKELSCKWTAHSEVTKAPYTCTSIVEEAEIFTGHVRKVEEEKKALAGFVGSWDYINNKRRKGMQPGVFLISSCTYESPSAD